MPMLAERKQRRLSWVVEAGRRLFARSSPSDLGLAADRAPRSVRLVLLLYAILAQRHPTHFVRDRTLLR